MYDAAQIHSLKCGIFERQKIVVEGAESRVGPPLHALVERIDHVVLETKGSRISSDDRVTLTVREAFISATGDIHTCPHLNKRYLRMHMLGNAGRRMQCDRGPHFINVGFRNVVSSEEAARRVGPVHFKAALTIVVLCSQTDVVEHGRHVKQFAIVLKVLTSSCEGAPEEDAAGMEEQQVVFRIADELRDITRELAVRDGGTGHIDHGDKTPKFRTLLTLVGAGRRESAENCGRRRAKADRHPIIGIHKADRDRKVGQPLAVKGRRHG
jgi:hypothetical protein